MIAVRAFGVDRIRNRTLAGTGGRVGWLISIDKLVSETGWTYTCPRVKRVSAKFCCRSLWVKIHFPPDQALSMV